MNNQKIIITAFLLAFIFSSCIDNRDEFLNEMKAGKNTAPLITLLSNNGVQRDSMKISQGTYKFDLAFSDLENNQTSVEFRVYPSGLWIYNEQTLAGSRIDLQENPIPEATVLFQPNAIGNNSIDITIKDEFDQAHILTFDLFVFENLPPVADFNYVIGGLHSKYEVTFTSTSFDPDKNFGGHLIKGVWFINGTSKEFKADLIQKFIFPGPGTYPVTLRVYDNNDAWHEIKKDITL